MNALLDPKEHALVAKKQFLIEKFKQASVQFILENSDRTIGDSGQERIGILPLPDLPSTNPRSSLTLANATGCTMSYPKGKLCIATGLPNAKPAAVYIVGSFEGEKNTAFGFVKNVASDRPQTKILEEASRILVTVRAEDTEHVVLLMLPMQIRQAKLGPNANDDLALSAYRSSGDPPSLGDKVPLPRADVSADVSEEACASHGSRANCMRSTLFTITISEAFLREKELLPSDSTLANDDKLRVTVRVLTPGTSKPVINTSSDPAVRLSPGLDIGNILQEGDSVHVTNLRQKEVFLYSAQQSASGASSKQELSSERMALVFEKLGRYTLNLLSRNQKDASLTQERIPAIFQEGFYTMTLTSSGQTVNREFALEAGRMVLIATGILAAIVSAWIAIERGFVKRVLKLTRRAADLSNTVKEDGDIERFDFARYGGQDEIGVLGTALDTLLTRISEDVRKQRLRLASEKDILHAIGHEIRSPLQALSALHPNDEDIEQRYISRMMRAIRALYGETSPTEAFEDAAISEEVFELSEFLETVANNAPYAGIHNVAVISSDSAVVKVDPSALEDVLAHILSNADDFRDFGTSIDISLERDGVMAVIRISNSGPKIPQSLLRTIFDYGFSTRHQQSSASGLGQGLFVARTYSSKMGSTIEASNTEHGVVFEIRIPALG